MDLAARERVFVAVARTATLATIAPDGRPRLIPICFVLERAAPVVWTPLDDKPKRSDDPRDLARVRDIVARPKVSMIVDRWDEDWDHLAWVRIHGQATLAEPGTADHEVAVSALRAKYPRYADHRLEIRPMIRIVIERATSWGAINPAYPPRNGVEITDASAVIARLGLAPHPEGGWYVETWRAPAAPGARPAGSAILYLLAEGEASRWHRIDAAEVWQIAAGGPLEVRVWTDGDPTIQVHRLGNDVLAGERPQVVVPPSAWQAARPLGAWSLVGCIVAPAFDFAGFELSEPGWEPTIMPTPGSAHVDA